MTGSRQNRQPTESDRADEPAGERATNGPTDAAVGGGPALAGLTRAEMEEAALAGRQVAGPLEKVTALRLLREGDITVVGRLLAASNATFFCMVAGPGDSPAVTVAASCVYKPIRGERPLYDFPDGTLACREVGAHVVSEASGWDIVPPTVMRDGPFGEGMVQLWVEVDESVDLTDLIGSNSPALRRIAVLDAVLNNADRKAGHLLPLPDGSIQGVDNGLCFSVEPKLRTVLWRWRGQPLTDEERAVLRKLHDRIGGDLGEALLPLLAPDEVAATSQRIEALLSSGTLPRPDRARPAVPWPPY
ncbi:MAG TPA: SCO1664 family protein [Candidatus Limnocylindrales bacterium]